MGYCMYMEGMEFFIAIEDAKKAFPIVKEALLEARQEKGSHFSWVNDADIRNAKCLSDIMDAFCWEPSFDADMNIDCICFNGEKLGCDDVLFDAIAPYVKEDSYIEMHGECGSIWRWVFKEGKCVNKEANISFD